MTPATQRGETDLHVWVGAQRARIVRLADGRLNIPAAMPYMEGHNTWCASEPVSTLVIPVADVAQHVILLLLYLVRNGTGIYDDMNGRQIPGLERFSHRLNMEFAHPMAFLEQTALTDTSVEMGTSVYAGALTLYALGLGGWMLPASTLSWYWAQAVIRRCRASASGPRCWRAIACRMSPVCAACSRSTSHRTTPTWPRRSCGASSAPVVGSTRRRADLAARTRPCAPLVPRATPRRGFPLEHGGLSLSFLGEVNA